MKLEQLNPIATQIQSILGQELISLGRNASGALINSLQHQIIPKGEFGFDLKILGNDYWRVVEYGVSAQDVPFDANTRSGATNSEYINGLMNWIRVKGMASDNDVVRSIAFAIATKQTSTSRGGFGLGNPMDKNKLGFVSKSTNEINNELTKISQIYESEVLKIVGNSIPNQIDIII
tara:strand:- start:1257 stop:1787 length:531 start_codon:yes stop_codon:yes gene_type:complete